MGYAPSLRSISTHRDQRNFDEEIARIDRRLRRVNTHIRKEKNRKDPKKVADRYFPDFTKHRTNGIQPDMSRGERLSESEMNDLLKEDANHSHVFARGNSTGSLRLGSFLATGTLEGVHAVNYDRSVARRRAAILFAVLGVMAFGLYLYVTA